MEGFVLEINKRGEIGAMASKRLRNEGFIPTIVYHRGEASIAGTVSYKDFVKLAVQAKVSQVFLLKSSDKGLDGRSAIVRDIQKDAVSGKPIHVDFQALKDDEEISITIPLHFIGEAIGVKIEGGSLSVHTHDIEVSCLPKDIPLTIQVDVTDLKLNSHMHAHELKLPTGVRLKSKKDLPIVSVVIIKEEEVATPAAATAEGAAPEGEAAAAGAAAATDEKSAAPAKEKEKK